ncbi:hypothetical protein [Labilibacter marinus]|uniref:hypothetical protein n=1 Tax=Labilibacter marinus TaxID=1477105 RepID=UPI00082EC680|nr:hypothetical protein [Labilibacter marinus]
MKTSGNRVMIVLSAVILGLTLIVPVLPAKHTLLNNEVEFIEQHAIDINDVFDTSEVSVDFKIGRERSIRL